MTDTPPLRAGTGAAGAGAHRVLIVGGGVAGLDLAGMLGRHPTLHVTLVDAATTHVWKPMLHSVAAGTQDMARAEVAYVAQARRHGFRYAPGRATGVDPQARTVRLAEFALHGHPMLPERAIPYDTLVLATGSVAGTFGVPGVVEHARHIDTQEEAHAFQEMVVPRLFEATATGRPLNIAIVGGGATGVQLAAELLQMADIVDDHGAGSAREALRITLLDRAPRLLAAFPERVSDAARARIEQLGVAVRLEADVASVDPDGVLLGDGKKVPAAFTIWAAGTEASPLAASLEALERGDGGRLVVDTRCRTTRFADIFAIGDCAMMVPHGRDEPLPPTAQVAFQQAVWLGRQLPRMIAGKAARPFRYRDYGALVQLGGYDAYGALGRLGFFSGGFLKGRVAQAGHALLYRRHQARLHGLVPMLGLWLADALTAGTRPRARLS